jgi:hypothetical protein
MGASIRSAVAQRSTPLRRSPSHGLALSVALALAAGCTASLPTPSPPPSPIGTPMPTADTTPPAGPSTAPPTVGPTPAQTPVKPHWETTGAMSLARESTHALLLGDGLVLVVGDDRWSDERYRSYLRTVDTSVIAELWDPGSGKWRATDPLPKPRAGFAAVVLQDGRALIAGGANQDCASYSSAYLFDPANEQWSKTGLMRTARTQPAAAVLRDGRVLVAGGYFSRSCQDWAEMRYDAPPTSPGVVLAAFQSPIDDATPRLDDVDPGPLGRGLATAELFDPATGTWSDTGSMRMVRAGASAVALGDGRVLVWGGREEYGGDNRAPAGARPICVESAGPKGSGPCPRVLDQRRRSAAAVRWRRASRRGRPVVGLVRGHQVVPIPSGAGSVDRGRRTAGDELGDGHAEDVRQAGPERDPCPPARRTRAGGAGQREGRAV